MRWLCCFREHGKVSSNPTWVVGGEHVSWAEDVHQPFLHLVKRGRFTSLTPRIRAGLETMCIEHLKDDYFVLNPHPMEEITRHLLHFNDECPSEKKLDSLTVLPLHNYSNIFYTFFFSFAFQYCSLSFMLCVLHIIPLWPCCRAEFQGIRQQIVGIFGVLVSMLIRNTWVPWDESPSISCWVCQALPVDPPQSKPWGSGSGSSFDVPAHFYSSMDAICKRLLRVVKDLREFGCNSVGFCLEKDAKPQTSGVLLQNWCWQLTRKLLIYSKRRPITLSWATPRMKTGRWRSQWSRSIAGFQN